MSLKFFHPLHLNFILPNFRSIPLRNEQTRPHFATSVETCFTRHGCELVYSAHNMRYEMPVTVVTSSRYYGVRRTLRRSARTPAVIKRVREKLRRNPRRSVVKLAQEEGIGRTTMTDIVTKDLGCKPYKMH